MEEVTASHALQTIVQEFNEKFKKWSEDYDMNVEFGWAYVPSKNGKGIKQLDLQKIDLPIFRKPIPTASHLIEQIKEKTNVQGEVAK
jgi:hypothetical protein